MDIFINYINIHYIYKMSSNSVTCYNILNYIECKLKWFFSLIIAMELFLPHQRVLYYSILECFLPIGSILVAYIASLVKDWRLLLQLVNIPGLLFLSYFWLLSFLYFFVLRKLTQYYCYFLIHRLTEESMRWLESQGKHDKVINTLKKIAAANKKPFPDLHTNTQTQVIF